MNTSEKIIEIIGRYTDTVFFLPGGGCCYLVDALGKSNLNRYNLLHEQACGYAAIGYAQLSGKLGVCLVTTGPGATNVLTPAAASWTDSIPVLFISGQARSDTLVQDTGMRTCGIQEINIIPIVKTIMKDSIELKSNKNIENIFTNIINTALSGRRGGVWVSVPLDVQGELYVY